MAILSIVKFFWVVVSPAILAGAVYLLWSWQDGAWVRDATGVLHREREAWRSWTGLGLLGWSFLGRFIVLALAARPDRRRTSAQRGVGRMLASPTGSRLYVESSGPQDAAPIIFTHGWGMDGSFWRYAREDLSNRFQVVVWDLPGLGRSKPASRDAIGLEAFAADLAALIDSLGGRRPLLVGHSIGGMIIQTLIRDQPKLQSRIAGVALLNTTYTNPLKTMLLSSLLQALQRPVLEPASRLMIALQPIVWLSAWQSYLSGSAHLAQRFGYGRFVTRSQLEHTTLLATRNPPAAQARGDLAMFRWDATGALRTARLPVLIVGGDRDIVTKLDASRTMAGDAAGAALQVVHGVNHMGPMERADLYNELVADFALQVQPGASHDRPREAAWRSSEPAARTDARPMRDEPSPRP